MILTGNNRKNVEKRRDRRRPPAQIVRRSLKNAMVKIKRERRARAGENVAATAAASVSASVRRARNSVQKLCATTTTRCSVVTRPAVLPIR